MTDSTLAARLQEQAATTDPLATVDHLPTGELVEEHGASAVGRYRILRPHAKGGLGEVFLAQDLELNREVALKEIQTQRADDADCRLRFLLEGEITGGLEHPGIVPVYGLGRYADGRPFYAMRFIRGDSLQDAVDQFFVSAAAPAGAHEPSEPNSRPSPPGLPPAAFDSREFRQLLGRFIDVCNAVAYAHSRGVLHRDLKPSNIMLGKFGETLVVDWGLAKIQGTSELGWPEGDNVLRPASASGSAPTVMGTALGTPAFMSPEQAAGKVNELGPGADVYSLGATLYYVLTGRLPFAKSAAIKELLKKVQAGEFPSPLTQQPRLPRPLAAICLKAMALQPQDRYSAPQALAEDLERYLADEPVTALAEPLTLRARRWVRKHPRSVAALAATLIIGIASATVIAGVVADRNQRLATANFQLTDANTKLHAANTAERAAAAAERIAKADAEQKKVAAETARDETEQVLKYLVASFRRADPAADGAKLTVAELLAQAESELTARFPQQPLLQARLLHAIGETYRGLGLNLRAAAAQARAMELREAKLGPGHEDTHESVIDLAIAYHAAGKNKEAIALLEGLRERLKNAQPSVAHLAVAANLGNMYSTVGRLREAAELQEEAVEMWEPLMPDFPLTLQLMHNLALTYHRLKRVPEAIGLYERALRRKQVVHSKDHPSTLSTMNNLANAYIDAGRLEEATKLHEETLELKKGRYGLIHPETFASLHNLGNIYLASQQVEKALPLYEQALELRSLHLGVDHAESLQTMGSLTMAYLQAGRGADAAALQEKRCQLLAAKQGPTDPDTLMAMGVLAHIYLQTGHSDKALPLIEQFLEHLRQVGVGGQGNLVKSLTANSAQLMKYGQFAAAEKYLTELRDLCDRAFADSWLPYEARSLLGGALAAQKKFAEAEPLLIEGYEELTILEASLPAHRSGLVRESLQRLIDLYTAWEKPGEAEKWQRKLKRLPARHPHVKRHLLVQPAR